MPPNQTLAPRKCRVCGELFIPKSPRSLTCSTFCSDELNRIGARARAREAAFLRPYDLSLGCGAEERTATRNDQPRACSDEADGGTADGKPDGGQSLPTPASAAKPTDQHDSDGSAEDGRTPEPASDADRADQRRAVDTVLAMPVSERFAFSRKWSSFQRSYARSVALKDIDVDFSDPLSPNRGGNGTGNAGEDAPDADVFRRKVRFASDVKSSETVNGRRFVYRTFFRR